MNFKLSPCGMIVRLHRDKIHASDLSEVGGRF